VVRFLLGKRVFIWTNVPDYGKIRTLFAKTGVEMSKRQEIREKRRRERIRNQVIIILLVVAGALLIAFALVLPTLGNIQQTANATIVPIVTAVPMVVDVPEDGKSMGDPNAPVKMDVWEDFQCSGCMYYSINYEPSIIQKYVATGRVYYTYHFYPIIDGGSPSGESHQSANAAMCALEQGRFWDYHAALYANWLGENVGSYTDARLTAIAESIGLDMKAFNTCFKADKDSEIINQDYADGQNLSITATPAIFINGQMPQSSAGPNYIPSVDDISNFIDAILANQ
jgi:protein-disulfide isomerase